MDLLKLENVSFDYSEQSVLKNVNFSVEKSDLILLDGPSGIGKSTLCKLLSGYLKPASGKIYIKGSMLEKPSRIVLYIPQEDDLFEWHTLKQHFNFIESLANTNVANSELLEILGLSGLLNQYPKELSAGQKKKAQIYKSYLINPELVIFDETFSSIDQQSTDKILFVFKKIWLRSGCSVIFVSHYSQNIKPFVRKIVKIENHSLNVLIL